MPKVDLVGVDIAVVSVSIRWETPAYLDRRKVVFARLTGACSTPRSLLRPALSMLKSPSMG